MNSNHVGVWVRPPDSAKKMSVLEVMTKAGLAIDRGPREYPIGGSTSEWLIFLDGSWVEFVRAVGIGAGGAAAVGIGVGLKKLFSQIFNVKQAAGDPEGGVTFIDNSTNTWIYVDPADLALPNPEWDKLANLDPAEQPIKPGRPPCYLVHRPDGGWAEPN